jgi:hypothetical protein
MKSRKGRPMLSLMAAGTLVYLLPGCSSLSTAQEGALLVGAETLANIAGTAAATYYGGPQAGELASAGLSALGSVLQGYVGSKVPTQVVEATPGVANVGEAVAEVIAPNRTVNQSDVNVVNAAALIVKSVSASITGTSGTQGE